MPVFNIHHVTKYEYDRPVKESVNEIRIYPITGPEQEILFHEVNITGQPEILVISDYWNNRTGMFNRIASHQELVIESKLIIRTLRKNELQFNTTLTLDDLQKEVSNKIELLELSKPKEVEIKEEIAAVINEFLADKKSTAVAAIIQQCSNYIYSNFKYIKGITTVETTTKEILEHRSGVCQDFAHVMLELLRSLGIPSRYVSGYICPDQQGMRGEGATHAWVEAWIPGTGWQGIDPTNNVWVTNHHVRLAVGRNFNDCSPIKGTFKGPARQSLSVYVSVGYEDGHVFEELNNVKLEKIATADIPIELLQSFAGQQQ